MWARYVREALAAGEPTRVFSGLCMEIGGASTPGPQGAKRVQQVYERAAVLGRELGDPPSLLKFLESSRGLAGLFFDEFTSALGFFDRADQLVDTKLDTQWVDSIRHTYRLNVLWVLGRYKDWPKVRQLTRVHSIDVEVWYLRGIAAIAASRTIPREPAIAIAARKHLERQHYPYPTMLAAQLRAAGAAGHGRRDEAIRALRQVIDISSALDIRGHNTAARMRLATVVDDADVRSSAAEAEAALRAEGVVSPVRFANMFTPGLLAPDGAG